MTRAELLRTVSEQVGRKMQACQLQYAQLIGEVDLGEKLPDGWRNYTEKHVRQFAEYARKRNHRARNRATASR
jgi:hypothetical protein